MDFSVIIAHFKRPDHLQNTLEGLRIQSNLPKEVVVVELGRSPFLEDNYPFDLHIIRYPLEWECLPLAAARNVGIAFCSTDMLIFLDVDCIPAPDFCQKIANDAETFSGLVMGTPRYLSKTDSILIDERWLQQNSEFHPVRPIISETIQEHSYECFWSLCFAIKRELFLKVGGFDEKFEGYGAEDTDFALSMKKKDIPFYLSGATVFHQQHPVCSPPLNHFNSIISNSRRFHKKWGFWPMEDSLKSFEALGLLKFDEKTDLWKVNRLPTEDEISASCVLDAPYR